MDAYANVPVMPAYRADKANVFANAVGVQIEQRSAADGARYRRACGAVLGLPDAFSFHGILLLGLELHERIPRLPYRRKFP